MAFPDVGIRLRGKVKDLRPRLDSPNGSVWIRLIRCGLGGGPLSLLSAFRPLRAFARRGPGSIIALSGDFSSGSETSQRSRAHQTRIKVRDRLDTLDCGCRCDMF